MCGSGYGGEGTLNEKRVSETPREPSTLSDGRSSSYLLACNVQKLESEAVWFDMEDGC